MVGLGVEEGRVGEAVTLQNVVVWVGATVAVGEAEFGGADVGAVKEDHRALVGDGGVHGGDASVGNQEVPRAWEVGMR